MICTKRKTIVAKLLATWKWMGIRIIQYLGVLGFASFVITTMIISHVTLHQVILLLTNLWFQTGAVEESLLWRYLVKAGAALLMFGSSLTVLFGRPPANFHPMKIFEEITESPYQSTLEVTDPGEKVPIGEASEVTKRTWKQFGLEASLALVALGAFFLVITWCSHCQDLAMQEQEQLKASTVAWVVAMLKKELAQGWAVWAVYVQDWQRAGEVAWIQIWVEQHKTWLVERQKQQPDFWEKTLRDGIFRDQHPGWLRFLRLAFGNNFVLMFNQLGRMKKGSKSYDGNPAEQGDRLIDVDDFLEVEKHGYDSDYEISSYYYHSVLIIVFGFLDFY